ncbi:MAG: carbamoyltransferase HypF [Kiritimatiellae bacterium]|nr:carbamoyltransferase HypF [Kiritimatiellia bacterium]MDD4341417.1 carbamoyltransferase HypF [Kiritimatiellia bacterium]
MTKQCSIVLRVRGRVQGVGFRPVVFRLAHESGLRGWVCNTSGGADILLAGGGEAIDRFRHALPGRLPAAAHIESIEERAAPADIPSGFEIRLSDAPDGARVAGILPDLATCPDCLREIVDPHDRRYRYPFANCTHCGPRFSILNALPYDRATTTMRGFRMCAACEAEYQNPHHRRFHAQPNACAVCGPHVTWTDAVGTVLAEREAALQALAEALRQGHCVAMKGLGGFHLLVDARDAVAVQRLRERKQRDQKPFAVLFPTPEAIAETCEVSDAEQAWLASQAAPIVLLRKRAGGRGLADTVAPGLPWIGAMLPYTPLHHLLMRDLGFPVVATSGNLTDEPICIDNDEALARLGTIADFFLLHDRPIARPMDDSVLAVCAGEPIIMRRGRGLAPGSIPLAGVPDGWLAAGAQMKSSVAVTAGGHVVMSPHIGDLDHDGAVRLWRRSVDDLMGVHGLTVERVVTDQHPNYASTRTAMALCPPSADDHTHLETVQHHHAHIAACMAENGLEGTVLGVAWDGTGLGTDGTIWGGEFLVGTRAEFRRAAWLRPFPLAGADAAAREPRRAALGVLREMGSAYPPPGFSSAQLALLDSMLHSGLNVVQTSSVGRLFDAVASLLGVCQILSHEGQAAMRLEALAGGGGADPYPFGWIGPALDWAPMMAALLAGDESPERAAARFHATLIEMIVAVAQHEQCPDVCLSGGCFQNRLLLVGALRRLTDEGFRVWRHRDVPPNDAGIGLGQVAVAAARRLSKRPDAEKSAGGCG